MTRKEASAAANAALTAEIASLVSQQREAMRAARVAQDRAYAACGSDAYVATCRAAAMMWERFAGLGRDINFLANGN